MPLLYFWRGDNYIRDLDYGAGYHLNQRNPLLHAIDPGDSLWAFTRRSDGAYVLAAELVVSGKTYNRPDFRYGRYRLWGNLNVSRYFQTDGQPDITVLIQSLSIRANGNPLGRAFQGLRAVRHISAQDALILKHYSQPLPLEKRARLIPEEHLEALLLSGDAAAVNSLLKTEPAGLAEQRCQYLLSQAITRNQAFSSELRRIYDDQCQLCGWRPPSAYGVKLCEGHHIRWLSRGGADDLSNMILLCPNHHRAVHRADAPFDFERRGFYFGRKFEALDIVHHSIDAC